jgi:hypothetical protein
MSRRYITDEQLVSEEWLELNLVDHEGEDLIFEIIAGEFDGCFLKIDAGIVLELLDSGGLRFR